MEPVQRADLIGAVLDGRYRVLEPVAQGAMGVVYRAERIKLGRIVAIKVLHESLPAELSSSRRFEIEAKAMAKLEHPHCASVVDVGLHEDRPFVVMDFVSGQNLKDVVAAEAPLPVLRAVEILRQILSGLAHAHELGIIHRDIKPANLVLSQKAGLGDHIKILDFGLARLSQDSSLTSGIVVGTPSYMAPEQIRGQVIDGRIDVYACGVVLFELLTGEKPYVSAKDDPLEVCSLHLRAPVPRLADRRPDLDLAALEPIVARALAKAVGERFASAVEFAAALDAVVPRRAPMTPAPGVPVVEPSATLEYAGAAVPARNTPAPGVRTLPLPALSDSPSGPLPGVAPSGPIRRPSSSGLGGPPPTATPSGPVPRVAPSGLLPPTATPSGPVPRVAPSGPLPPTATPSGPVPRMAPSGPLPAAPRPRRRLAIFAAVGLAAAAAVAVVVVATSGESDSAASPAAGSGPPAAPPDAALDPADETVARANELIAAGQKAAALELVLAARRLYPADARMAFLVGKLYFDKYYWTEGMKLLREAIRLEPSYRTDRELIRTVLRGFLTTPRADPALAAFLREDIGEPAKPLLEETAADHPTPHLRARAAAELKRYP